jgi:hypothetical protein
MRLPKAPIWKRAAPHTEIGLAARERTRVIGTNQLAARTDELFSFVTAISLTAGALWSLSLLKSSPRHLQTPPATIEVIWLAPAPPKPLVPGPEQRVPEQVRQAQVGGPGPQVRREHPRGEAASELTAQSEVPGPPTRLGTAPLNLSVPAETVSFQREPLGSQSNPIRLEPDRIRLSFTDRSIGGTLQRMTKAQICVELSQALRSAGSNAAVIIGNMQEHGCTR